jgi:hypothetical protein
VARDGVEPPTPAFSGLASTAPFRLHLHDPANLVFIGRTVESAALCP